LSTADFKGSQVWNGTSYPPHDEEDSYPYPLHMKIRPRSGSRSGASTPGRREKGGLSETDLATADQKLSHVDGMNGNAKQQ